MNINKRYTVLKQSWQVQVIEMTIIPICLGKLSGLMVNSGSDTCGEFYTGARFGSEKPSGLQNRCQDAIYAFMHLDKASDGCEGKQQAIRKHQDFSEREEDVMCSLVEPNSNRNPPSSFGFQFDFQTLRVFAAWFIQLQYTNRKRSKTTFQVL